MADPNLVQTVLPTLIDFEEPEPPAIEEILTERYDAHQHYVVCTCFTHPGAPCALTVYPDRGDHAGS